MSDRYAPIGGLDGAPRVRLMSFVTPVEEMSNLGATLGRTGLYIKRDDLTGLAFGGNKVRQLEFYLGAAVAEDADTILITGAVQSNFVRLAAAAARRLGMDCHVQLEERVRKNDPLYRESGNVLVDRMLGAAIHSYPDGEDEAGADARLHEIADDLRSKGRKPYIIPLSPGHPPLGALGYVDAARELLAQCEEAELDLAGIVLASGSGHTHAGLLFGLRALDSKIPVTGICVRRTAAQQAPRIADRCKQIAELLGTELPVGDGDVIVDDRHFAPGYGGMGEGARAALRLAATCEGLITDPVYTAKAMAGFIDLARASAPEDALLFIHTGGTPAIFAYATEIAAGAAV